MPEKAERSGLAGGGFSTEKRPVCGKEVDFRTPFFQNPCRFAAHLPSSLFTLHSSLSKPPPVPRASGSNPPLDRFFCKKQQPLEKSERLFWRRRRDLNLLRRPPCGARNPTCGGFAALPRSDRCGAGFSLFPPLAAVEPRTPAGSRRFGFKSQRLIDSFAKNNSRSKKSERLFWRRRRDLNPRAGFPTYALSRGASSTS